MTKKRSNERSPVNLNNNIAPKTDRKFTLGGLKYYSKNRYLGPVIKLGNKNVLTVT